MITTNQSSTHTLTELRRELKELEAKSSMLTTKDLTLIGFDGFQFQIDDKYYLRDRIYFTCFGGLYFIMYDAHELAEKSRVRDYHELTITHLLDEIIANRIEWNSFDNWSEDEFEEFKVTAKIDQ